MRLLLRYRFSASRAEVRQTRTTGLWRMVKLSCRTRCGLPFSNEKSTPFKVVGTRIKEPRPEFGFDCLICAEFARQQVSPTPSSNDSSACTCKLATDALHSTSVTASFFRSRELCHASRTCGVGQGRGLDDGGQLVRGGATRRPSVAHP